MATLDNIINEVRREAFGCPEMALKYAVQRAIREFCQETYFHEKTLLLNVVKGQGVYPLDLNIDEEVIAVRAVEFKQRAIQQIDPSVIPPGIRNQDTGANNWFRFFSFEPPYYLTLYPYAVVDAVEDVKVKLILQPKTDADYVPDSVDRNFRQTIVHGALSYLLEQPNTDWFAPELAAKKMVQFKHGVSVAKGQRLAGMSANGSFVRPRRYI